MNNAERMTFWVVVLCVLAYAFGWGMVWKILVGVAAGLDLFLIGVKTGQKLYR